MCDSHQNVTLRLLCVCQESKLLPEREIIENLGEYSIAWKIVGTSQFLEKGVRRLPILNRTKKKKFERLLDEFNPDFVMLDSPSELGPIAAGKKIPVLVYFWDNWSYREMERDKMVYRSMYHAVRARVMNPCLKRASVILAETDSVADTIREHHPRSSVTTFPYSSIDTDYWSGDGRNGRGMALRHPCVGLLQHANEWFKAKEMLILPRVVEALPHVTFYWAGDGRYRDRILGPLAGYDNFEWLGALEYPDRVRDYLSSIDIYGLASAIEMSPYSLKQAMSMGVPAIVTDSDYISATMLDGKTGFLVRRGDHEGWIERILLLLGDVERAQEVGRQGRRFVRDSWDSRLAAEKLVAILKSVRSK